MQVAGDSFKLFMEYMKKNVNPIANYNMKNITNAKYLDQFVKLIMQRTLAPSNELIANLDIIRNMLKSKVPGDVRNPTALATGKAKAAASVNALSNRHSYINTRSFRATAINQCIANVLAR